MAFGDYVTPERTLLLKSVNKEDALRELAFSLCRDCSGLELEKVMAAILDREQSVSSRITGNIALPHALLPFFDKQLVAVGFSREGIPWDSPTGERVNLIIMSVYGESFTDEHLRMLAELARTINTPSLTSRLSRAGSSLRIHEILRGAPTKKGLRVGAREKKDIRTLLKHACSLVRESRAKALMLLSDDEYVLEMLNEREVGAPIIIVTEDSSESRAGIKLGQVLAVPFFGMRRYDRVKLAVLFALSHGLVDKGDTVICLSGEQDSGALNTLEVIDVAREFNILLSLRAALAAGDISSHVLDRILQIATSLAREGREGRPVGAIFVLGDYENVRKRCHQLVINPFRGYPEDERNILDPGLEETVKEFSRIDGAFLIRGDGVIMSMGSYIHTEDTSEAQEPGLGARHAAALAITKSTQAFSVVISQSTQRISLFRQGRLVMALGQTA